MKYMGSKSRFAKYLLPIILKDRKPNQWYIEPFVGGANMIDKVEGNRVGNDIDHHLIEALKLIQTNPKSLPDLLTEDIYKHMKDNPSLYDAGLYGFVGFSMAFGSKWYGTYRRDVAGTKGCLDNMRTQSRRSKESAIKQSKKIQGVKFTCMSYLQLEFPADSIIYCDPPYEGTTKYKNDFDHDKFWQWCRILTAIGHEVFISEYNAPDDFDCIWEKEITVTLNNQKNSKGDKKASEKLFRYKG